LKLTIEVGPTKLELYQVKFEALLNELDDITRNRLLDSTLI